MPNLELNLNRIFRLGIRSKLVIAFLTLSTVPLIVSGFYAVRVHTEALEHAELEHLEHDVLTVCERAATFLEGVEGDLRFLAGSRLFRRSVETADEDMGRLLVNQVVDFARSKGIYYQIRYLDWAGGERMKVRALRGGFGMVAPDPAAPVQFYRHLLSGLRPGEMTSVAVELPGEGDQLVAAISHALVVAGADGQSQGALVVDAFASYLFQIVEGAHKNLGGALVLVNAEGLYLYRSERKNSWGQLLASRAEENVRRDYPADVAAQIMSGSPGVLVTEGQVIAHAPILQTEPQRIGVYTVYMSAPRDVVLGSVGRFQRVFYGLLVVFILLSIVLAFVAAGQFTRPVNALQEGARVIAGGQFGRRLKVDTYDEIQQLADTFNVMAGALEEREARIHQHESELAAMVTERTAELAAEKGKLQAILDAVPSAFVLLDRQLNILSASRAFESICGHTPEAVVGKPYGLFCDWQSGADFTAELALRSGIIHTGLHSLGPKESARPRQIERVAIPVAANGIVERVIEVLTDVTDRKEMEARIIQSEKLATTGEMAALIAHEMRNSLTSVKMILQLELERQDLADADREALGVASAAVRRMETVVTDLLKFARPSPPELQPRQIPLVVDDSLSLIQHQLVRQGVSVVTDVSSTTPAVMGDGDQLKEVFVNLLLNAAQAAAPGGRICLSSRADGEENLAVVEVVDDGPGVPEDQRERIFDPFYTTKTDGTGLGLSTARRTVEAHGGRISAGTADGGGAVFTVRLPGYRAQKDSTWRSQQS